MLEYKAFSNEKDLKQLLQRDNDTQLSLKNDGQLDTFKAMNQG